jgi:hypothetical protein
MPFVAGTTMTDQNQRMSGRRAEVGILVDAPDRLAVGEHVVVLVLPLAWMGGRRMRV